jgi:hypothetical protein
VSDLQTFIKNRELELTLCNEMQDAAYVGTASDIIPNGDEHILKFPVTNKLSNICPWTIAILHSGRRVFKSFYIQPVLDANVKTIEVVWPD